MPRSLVLDIIETMLDVVAPTGEPVCFRPGEDAVVPEETAPAAAVAMDEDSPLDAEELELARKVKEWALKQLDAEVARVQACGQRILKLTAKNCGIVRPEGGSVFNRVEVDTEFDFDSVKQIMMSDPEACPLQEKQGFCLRFVVLSNGKPTLLILPYLYDSSVADNSLQDWEFINNKMQSSRHHVNCFADNGEEKDVPPPTKQQLAAAAAARRSKTGGRRRR